MRARSEARNTAAVAVSEILAGTFRKLRLAILVIAWSLVMPVMLITASIVCWMVRLSVFAVVRRHTTLTPTGLTSKARFSMRVSMAAECGTNACRACYMTARRAACQEKDHA